MQRKGEEWLRVPVSYLLKLALADVIAKTTMANDPLSRIGIQLQKCFLNREALVPVQPLPSM